MVGKIEFTAYLSFFSDAAILTGSRTREAGISSAFAFILQAHGPHPGNFLFQGLIQGLSRIS